VQSRIGCYTAELWIVDVLDRRATDGELVFRTHDGIVCGQLTTNEPGEQ